ncbi:hypothetical protein BJ138DRAFT_1101950 [Hygrophoropsis aurantiaca]|uniref:Uncharacterized protein n=1 Tax=Hygrophoropsis aurantiaca TaxID=72124 RepID=A0ACB8AB29_9AGAM|nr:hypothetical protein BJ138DRAFT_1101950 [Hygrophoropsis aurantiaca]
MSAPIVSTPPAVASSQNVTLPAIPELTNPNFLDVLLPPGPAKSCKEAPAHNPEVPKNAMMDALRETTHHTLTANGALAFDSTSSPTLDAFYGIGPFSSAKTVNELLEKAWEEDPNLTLRIIWLARSIHDGKADKELFYKAFGWLYKNHPRTAIANLPYLVDPVCLRRRTKKIKNADGTTSTTTVKERAPHGYWKDLANILALETTDELYSDSDDMSARATFLHNHTPRGTKTPSSKEEVHALRAGRAEAMHARLLEKLTQPNFRALYVAVARLFANRLLDDDCILTKMDSLPKSSSKERRSHLFTLSLAGKWAPSPHGSHDRVTNISTAIALLVHHAQVTGLHHRIPFTLTPSALDTHVLRSFYKRHILTPLRRALSVPEPLMSAGRWSEILYSRVSSVAMKTLSEKFLTHDPTRFVEFLTDVEKGEATISGATLFPHELVHQAVQLTPRFLEPSERKGKKMDVQAVMQNHRAMLKESQLRVVEAQWKTLVARLDASGELDNCIAVCDVSGSMGTLQSSSSSSKPFDLHPIWPALALSLLVARLANPPFRDAFITFSASPEVVSLDPNYGIADTVRNMVCQDWGMNTDFNAVFLDLILPLAVKHGVKKEEMIKRVFVFSDMQFDRARWSSTADAAQAEWDTNHDVIERAYADAGYDVPEIVYWDLARRGGTDLTAPVTGEKKGVALVNGFSPSLLKMFMDVEDDDEDVDPEWEEVKKEEKAQKKEKEVLTPIEMMKKTLAWRSFEGLIVID